jgi:predicted acyltransferase
MIALGYVWSWVFPINKNIWTSSYTLFTGGQAMCFFGLAYWFIDVKEKKRFTDWGVAFGINAITVFFLSGIIGRLMFLIKFSVNGEDYTLKSWLYEEVYRAIASPINASLLYAIMWIFLFYLLARWMKKKNIIIKV